MGLHRYDVHLNRIFAQFGDTENLQSVFVKSSDSVSMKTYFKLLIGSFGCIIFTSSSFPRVYIFHFGGIKIVRGKKWKKEKRVGRSEWG